MESNSNKQHDNSQSIYPSYQGMSSPYSSHPQQLTNATGYEKSGVLYTSQTPLYQQNGITTMPTYQVVWKNKLPTAITTNLRMFLFISGFIYSFWGISMTSLQVAIVINTFSTSYYGFYLGAFLIITGIVMMVVAFRSYYPLIHLKRIYNINLCVCLLGLIFSITDYTRSTRCSSTSSSYCDDTLASHLKIILVITYVLGFIHTIINKSFISKEHQQTVWKANSDVANY
ncbi:unnamed protein product [Adineta steineri]|uniref:MARVEL domain-containing protein n=1 Tax=Adineta steineri TaxID=433720 RepID=A0A815XS63_9BILA|nr:unnamed protein product [Adineta steineri]CAF1561722.1 unnamed protein product [Adineta steineri]